MLVQASPKNLSAKQAIAYAKESINQKSLFDYFRRSRVIDEIVEQDVVLLYIPYYIGLTAHRLSGGRVIHGLAAAEGITGEAGVAVNRPVFKETEIQDDWIIAARVSEEDAREKIIRCAETMVMRRKRTLPETEIVAFDKIYKPTYIMPMHYRFGKEERSLVRFVDAESGYVVYRYDTLWRTFPQLVHWQKDITPITVKDS